MELARRKKHCLYCSEAYVQPSSGELFWCSKKEVFTHKKKCCDDVYDIKDFPFQN